MTNKSPKSPKRPKARKRKLLHKPGAILRYVSSTRTPPRRKAGEILCHNHVAHLADMFPGLNGFRYFICDGRPGHGWELCPCGWRPEFGEHYALPDHVAFQRERIAAGEPLTMGWDQGLAVPPGFKRVGQDRIAKDAT